LLCLWQQEISGIPYFTEIKYFRFSSEEIIKFWNWLIHQACEFALHFKFLWALKAKDQLMSSIIMVQPLGVAVKIREILISSLPEIC